ncbi:uncharacterized protein, partial [Epargyreus clarus]|uniref:uncharacterized protein n=1 Tax=Epargyreus clarus TaxID=520877 RepID=UPI003C2E5A2F
LAGAGPSRAGPIKNNANLNGSTSPHNYDKTVDNKEIGSNDSRSPKPVVHNISINVTDADSPVGVRRRIHLRSLSDVTPASRSLAPRARSHSERPRASAAPSPALSLAPSPAHPAAPAPPRHARSERSSPDAALHALADDAAPRAARTARAARSALSVLGDPWRKMSEADLDAAARRPPPSPRASFDAPRGLDPWVMNTRSASRDDVAAPAALDREPRPGRGRRGKLERRAAVVCETCGNSSCECWRPHSPAAPRCTCEARSPRPARPSPARLAPRTPVRAHSDDEDRPRRLYKSASQKVVCASMDGESVKKIADPLLETTC